MRLEQRGDAGSPEPFTFSVPVSMAGLTLFADFRVSASERHDGGRALHEVKNSEWYIDCSLKGSS